MDAKHLGILKYGLFGIMAVALSACSVSPTSKASFSSKTAVVGEIKTETKFKAGKRFGPASERIVRSALEDVPRGGGRAVVGKPYKINGRWYKPKRQPQYNKVGIASWYGPNFHGRKTANGEIYDQTALSAAHPTLPLPSYVRVTNLSNKRSVIVRVNDRGPFVKNRLIDLSYRTAELLGTRAGGLAKVQVKYVGAAPVHGNDEKYLLASYKGPGSTRPSKIAARKKLLTYAGIKGSDEELTQIASSDFGKRDLLDEPRKPKPVLVANAPKPAIPPVAFAKPHNQVTAIPASFKAPIPVRSRLIPVNEPLVLTPKNLSPGLEVPSHPVLAPKPIRAGFNAYFSTQNQQARINNVFENLAVVVDNPEIYEHKKLIHIGTFQNREKINLIKDELARFGDVLLEVTDEERPHTIVMKLETKLPFAMSAIKRHSPTAYIIE